MQLCRSLTSWATLVSLGQQLLLHALSAFSNSTIAALWWSTIVASRALAYQKLAYQITHYYNMQDPISMLAMRPDQCVLRHPLQNACISMRAIRPDRMRAWCRMEGVQRPQLRLQHHLLHADDLPLQHQELDPEHPQPAAHHHLPGAHHLHLHQRRQQRHRRCAHGLQPDHRGPRLVRTFSSMD